MSAILIVVGAVLAAVAWRATPKSWEQVQRAADPTVAHPLASMAGTAMGVGLFLAVAGLVLLFLGY